MSQQIVQTPRGGGACKGIAAYDTVVFTPAGMPGAIQTLRVTTFCAPATVYRFSFPRPQAAGT